jgi:hypothetical protein
MKASELKNLLLQHAEKSFQLRLPSGSAVPVSFHITEVGHVKKRFIDCGGRLHEQETCLLQAWVGEDQDHRIAAGKMLAIFEKASAILPHTDLPVEVEYEGEVISQYPVSRVDVGADAVVLELGLKHTDCLAKDVCIPQAPAAANSGCGCGPGCC